MTRPPATTDPSDAELRVHGILDDLSEGVGETTLDGRIVAVNRAFASMLGYESPADLIARVSDVSVIYARPEQRAEMLERASRNDESCRADVELRGCDGRRLWVRAKFRARRDANGTMIGALIVAEDITATREAEARAREAEERLQFAFSDNPMPLVVVEFTPAGNIVTEANTALERMLGYGAGELIGVDVDSFVHDDDIAREHASLLVPTDGRPARVSFETRRRHKDGHWVPVALTAITLQSRSGRRYGIAALEDITSRRASEAERRAALALFEARAEADEALADLARLTLQSADVETLAFTACGLTARVLGVDFCAIELPAEARDTFEVFAEWGFDRRLIATVDSTAGADSQATYTAAHPAPVIVDDWSTERRFACSPLLAAHDVRSGMSVAIRHDQTTIGVISVQTRTARCFDDGAVRFLESTAQLVGVALEQDRVRHRLSQSERTLQSIVDNAPVAIHVLDAKGRFLLVNRELERIIGVPRDLLVGKTPDDVPSLRDGAPLTELVDGIEALDRRTPISREHTAAQNDGVHSYLTVDFPLVDLDNRAYGVGSISTEVTALVRSRAETRSAWLESMSRLARAVEFRDDATGAHIERMAAYAELLAHLLGLPEERCARIRLAAPLHDLGKIAIPDRVLLKRGPLNERERQIMETHADAGYRLLTGSGSELLELAATIARSHHERYDGRGYPLGLRANEIPVEGRIVAVADAFDALTVDRVYHRANSVEHAVDEMVRDEGHFDPEILELFVRRLDLVKGVWAIHHPDPAAISALVPAVTNGSRARDGDTGTIVGSEVAASANAD